MEISGLECSILGDRAVADLVRTSERRIPAERPPLAGVDRCSRLSINSCSPGRGRKPRVWVVLEDRLDHLFGFVDELDQVEVGGDHASATRRSPVDQPPPVGLPG